MCSYDQSQDGAPVLQINAELQQAHLDLLTAHCTTHQLRQRYSTDDLIRFGRRDVLRKSAEAASALHHFYSSIESKIPQAAPIAGPEPSPDQIAEAVAWLSTYLREQRAVYFPKSTMLSNRHKAVLWPYFSSALLDQLRVVELRGDRIPIPDFYTRARAFGFDPPEISHMDSVTFLDVIAFNEQLTSRALFHAAVHTTQIQILGLDRYADLWIQGFLRTRAHFTVPLEVHAFALASKFLRPNPERFSVEDQIRKWVAESRY